MNEEEREFHEKFDRALESERSAEEEFFKTIGVEPIADKGKKVGITGGHGFLAYNLYQYLRREEPGAQIWLFDHRYGQDILNYEQLSEWVKGMDVVFHLAANTHVDYSISKDREERRSFIDNNYTGTFNVLEACREHGVKMVHVSSSEVYGANQYPGKAMTEEHPLNPEAGTYAVSKAAADHECRVHYEVFGTDVVIIRPFNLFGYGQSRDKLIPKFIHQTLYGEPLTVNGSGEQRRDYLFALDCAEALWKAKDLPAGTIVNVGTDNAYSVNEIADMVIDVIESKYPSMKVHTTNVKPRPNDLAELRGSYEKLNELTGWYPKHSLGEAIEKVYEWYRANDAIEPPQRLIKNG